MEFDRLLFERDWMGMDIESLNKQSFDLNWGKRKEGQYIHWTRGEAESQIQFSFKNLWGVFQEICKSRYFNKGKRCLEVGCGRGSLSAYFCDSGYKCALLDKSNKAIEIARRIFSDHNLKADFVVGDVNDLPFENSMYDIVFSIGLLEHFKDIKIPIKEQIRVLDKGGLFIAYIVPENRDNVQKDYEWINEILKGYVNQKFENNFSKRRVSRTKYNSGKYVQVLKSQGVTSIRTSGVYPLPMISHSIEFPFTLMPAYSEKALVRHFKKIMGVRGNESKKNPWFCDEAFGQAFMIWGFKS